MERSEIVKGLKKVLVQSMQDKASLIDSIDESYDLRTQVGLNSIGMICMVILIETEFGIQFEDIGFSDFVTVGDVVDYISKRLM